MTVDRLGNLTLLPRVENSAVGNQSWKKKRLLYEVLSAPTVDEHSARLAAAKMEGIDVSENTEAIVQKAQYLPLVSAVCRVKGEWSTLLIDKRSRRIAELAWDELWKWLECGK